MGKVLAVRTRSQCIGRTAVEEDILRQQLTSTRKPHATQRHKRLARRLGRSVRSGSQHRGCWRWLRIGEKTDTSISRQWTARAQQGQPPLQSSCDWSYRISLNMLTKQWGPSSSQESSNGPFQRHQNELRFPQEALSCIFSTPILNTKWLAYVWS